MAPLTAGEARVFPSSHQHVLAALTQAFGEADIRMDSTERLDSATTMLLGTRGMSLTSYGEVVRVVVGSAAPGATAVRVITARRYALDSGSGGDWSDRLFANVDRILSRWDSTGLEPRRAGSDSASVVARTLVLSSLNSDRTVRVRGPVIGTLTGHPLGVRSGMLEWAGAEQRPAVRIAAIDSIWVRKGHGRIGALVGATLVGLVEMATAHPTMCSGSWSTLASDLQSCRQSAMEQALLKVVGIGLGALLGHVVGDAVPSWHRRFP